MRVGRLLICMALLAALALAQSKDEATRGLTLELEGFLAHGRVVTIKGKTDPHARVTVNGQNVPTINPDGSFAYDTPPLSPGEQTIRVRATNGNDVVTRSRKVVIAEQAPPPAPKPEPPPAPKAPQNAVMYGTVYDRADKPVSGVQVTVTNRGLALERHTTTAADGVYTFSELPPASDYAVTATASDGRTDKRSGIILTAGEESVIFPALKLDVPAVAPHPAGPCTRLFVEGQGKSRQLTDRLDYLAWDRSHWSVQLLGNEVFVFPQGFPNDIKKVDAVQYLESDGSQWTVRLDGMTFVHTPNGAMAAHTDGKLDYLDWNGTKHQAGLTCGNE